MVYGNGEMTKQKPEATLLGPAPLPELVGRIAVLGGTAQGKTVLLVGLASRQVRQHGTVVCLDGRHHPALEMQFRLVLRTNTFHKKLPSVKEVPHDIAQTALKMVTQGLGKSAPPSLLLLDGVRETLEWENLVSFVLKAGAVVVEVLLTDVLPFGRYDTLLLLPPEKSDEAELLSRTAGRRVSSEHLQQLHPGEALLVHFSQVYRVTLPQ
jgi:hypothetical protein